MPTEIPDLWGDDIKVDVLSPLMILKAQDEAIRRKTQGVLRAEITTREVSGFENRFGNLEKDDELGDNVVRPNWLIHTLDIASPVLAYCETLLEVRHAVNRAYPATLTVPAPIQWDLDQDSTDLDDTTGALEHSLVGDYKAIAYSAAELLRHLRRALQSQNTRAAVDSMLALANETKEKVGQKS